jgi:hypothetical protein
MGRKAVSTTAGKTRRTKPGSTSKRRPDPSDKKRRRSVGEIIDEYRDQDPKIARS